MVPPPPPRRFRRVIRRGQGPTKPPALTLAADGHPNTSFGTVVSDYAEPLTPSNSPPLYGWDLFVPAGRSLSGCDGP
jgi:hypothetical protein